MRMTVDEIIRIAEAHKYGEKLASITEYPDRYEVCYVGGSGEILTVGSSLYVMKGTGEIGPFFPPDYDDAYLDSGVDVPIPDDYVPAPFPVGAGG